MGGRGSGGKNRKPTAQKQAEGNPGKRKLNAREPKALPGEPQMPAWLNKAARKVWPEICETLFAAGVLYKSDGIAVAALCSSLVLFQKADAAIAKYGSLHVELDEVTGAGVLRTAPAVRVRSDALKHLRSSWQAFGLDPSSRGGIRVPETDKPPSTLEKILRSKSKSDEIVH
jgi:P27 family predicted phage terminase small subunit